jgi:long-chain acyl-CoA synthetase
LLERGHDVVWFPEGRRSPDGELQEFQQGVGLVLRGAQAQAVPTAIRGTFAAWPRHRRWPRPGRIDIVFGAPLHSRDLEPSVARSSLESAVRSLLHRTAAGEPFVEGDTDGER